MEFCLHEFGEKSAEHILENKFAVEQLRVQCEMAKKILTKGKDGEAHIICPKLSNGKDLNVKITRENNSAICNDLMTRCVHPIVMAIKDAGVTVDNINEIALVGDFTQTPMIT